MNYINNIREKFFGVDKMTKCSYSEVLYTNEEITYTDFDRQHFINEIRRHFAEKKIRSKKKKHRKPSNVIYVVVKPQPGQVRGDWAVRGHGKLYSHHRTKIIAIKMARKIAKKCSATVMVQKTDGTFSRGFKPRVNNQY